MAERSTEAVSIRRRTTGILERGRTTRRNLIRTATRLWSERGFETVTVEDICIAAGIGRTTFYLHFESKEQLLSGLAAATRDGVASDLADLDTSESLQGQLEVFIVGLARRMEDVPKTLAKLVIRRVQCVQGDEMTEEHIMRRFADLLRVVLIEARDRGELLLTADTEELGEILGALTMDAIESWTSGRTGKRPLVAVLRSRFAIVVDPYRTVPAT